MTMRCRDTATIPLEPHRASIEMEKIKGSGENGEFKGTRYLYKGVVVGTGPYRIPPGVLRGARGSLSRLKPKDFPGF